MTHFYILIDRFNKDRKILKSTWFIITSPDYTMLLSLLRIDSIQNRAKLKIENQRYRNTKTQKDENLLLPNK